MKELAIKNVSAGYGDAEILHDISLNVGAGEVVTLIGPNGAGKSTLLKTIMGYLHPSAGSISWGDTDLTSQAPYRRVHSDIAYVPQLDNVFPSLTVAENLRMGGYTLARGIIAERTEAQYERFPRLAERRRQRVQTLSGGERQMLAMARALMTEPQLLLLDEPSAALSPKLAGEAFERVEAINAEGRSVLIVEQNAEGSLAISSRCVVLVDGRQAFEAPADRILHDDKLRSAYLGAT